MMVEGRCRNCRPCFKFGVTFSYSDIYALNFLTLSQTIREKEKEKKERATTRLHGPERFEPNRPTVKIFSSTSLDHVPLYGGGGVYGIEKDTL